MKSKPWSKSRKRTTKGSRYGEQGGENGGRPPKKKKYEFGLIEETWGETRDRAKTTGTNGDYKLEEHIEYKDERSMELKETEDSSETSSTNGEHTGDIPSHFPWNT